MLERGPRDLVERLRVVPGLLGPTRQRLAGEGEVGSRPRCAARRRRRPSGPARRSARSARGGPARPAGRRTRGRRRRARRSPAPCRSAPCPWPSRRGRRPPVGRRRGRRRRASRRTSWRGRGPRGPSRAPPEGLQRALAARDAVHLGDERLRAHGSRRCGRSPRPRRRPRAASGSRRRGTARRGACPRAAPRRSARGRTPSCARRRRAGRRRPRRASCTTRTTPCRSR